MNARKMISSRHINFNNLMSTIFRNNNISEYFNRNYKFDGAAIHIYSYEKYFYRIESNLTITVIAKEDKEGTKVDIISSGGGKGVVELSYGAETTAINEICQLLENNGFLYCK